MISLKIENFPRQHVIVRHNPDTGALVVYISELGVAKQETIKHIKTANELAAYIQGAVNGKGN